jgi:hypothetical protein
MTYGIKPLRKILLGRETTAGTEADATTYWRGEGVMEDQLEVVFPDEDVGYLSGTDRSYIPKVAAAITFDETPATFEQVLHIFEAGIRTDAPSQNGTGSGYIYEYQWPTTTPNTIKTYTIEAGDNSQEEQATYFFVTSFTLAGAPNQAVTNAADWAGRQVAPGTYTTNATIPTVEEILFNKAKLYIDTAGGTFGGTQKTGTFLGFDLKVTTGWTARFTGDGQLYFAFVKQIMPEAILSVTMENDATGVAEKAAWLAQTPRKIRLRFDGSALTTVGGGSYTTKTLIIDAMGKWEKFGGLDEDDGDDTVTGDMRIRYNSTASQNMLITVVNELSAVQ